MRVLRTILFGALILALLYGALLFAERLTTQELTRVAHPPTGEAVCLMWKPRFLTGGGLCFLDLQNSEGKVLDSATLGTLDAAFNGLQQFGQLGFQGKEITVSNLQTGELVRRYEVREGRLVPQE